LYFKAFGDPEGVGRRGIEYAVDNLMPRDQRGFTLVELLVVVAVIAILTTISLTIFNNVQSRSRMAKAQADTQTMASAVGAFQAHMGQMPAALADLTVAQTNASGQVAGPFMAADPAPPAGWTYGYATGGPTGYTITATGDNTTITRP
jgi:prepilin-type N-terminal cleavage/methylation domain-containing protein